LSSIPQDDPIGSIRAEIRADKSPVLLEVIMFFRTLNLTKFKENPSEPLSEVSDGRVLQLLHGGHDVKVIMTQDHYFQLLANVADLKNALALARGEALQGEPHVLGDRIKENIRERVLKQRRDDGYHNDNSVGSGKKDFVRGSA
jgi:hypothetical protein